MASLIQTRLTADALLRQHGLTDAGWRFDYDNAVRRGGACHYSTKRITLSQKLVPLWSDAEVLNTLRHEAAHAMAGSGAGHGPKWRRIARAIGCDASRTHNNAVVEGRYVAVCDHCNVEVGRKHRMSPAMSQGRHAHAACGKVVRWVDTQTVVR